MAQHGGIEEYLSLELIQIHEELRSVETCKTFTIQQCLAMALGMFFSYLYISYVLDDIVSYQIMCMYVYILSLSSGVGLAVTSHESQETHFTR